MKPIIQIQTISEINSYIEGKTKHPLVAVVDFSKLEEKIEDGTRISCDFYSIMFKNHCLNGVRYGRQNIDFQDGSLICIAPKQMLTIFSDQSNKEDMKGWGLFFHPDLLRGTSLAKKMDNYSFFSYDMREALHLSDKEKEILYDCIQKIESELE